MNVENRVNEEVYYGVIPTTNKDKIYGFWDILLATGAWAIATWCYVHGGTGATILGLKEMLSNTFFGMTLAGLLLCLAVIIPTRYGIDLWVYQKAVFGPKGMIIIAILAIGANFGYEAINAQLYSNSITKIIEATGIHVAPGWSPWIASTCILFGLWIALRGPIAVKKATRIMVPSLMAVGIIIVMLVFSKYSFAELAAIIPINAADYPNRWEAYMVVMEWNIAFIFAWYAALGVLPRLVKTERESYWGHVGGFAMIMAIFICIGAITSLAMLATTGVESVDPTEWLIALGGPALGLLSLIFIGIANITTQAVALYSFTVSTKVLKPEWKYRNVALFWTAWCLILVFWGGVWNYYNTFLSVVGCICGPGVALILVDFYIIRKQRFSMKSLYSRKKSNAYSYTGGFNIPVCIAFICGVITYFLVYDPINAVPRSSIFLYTTATGLAMLVSAATYWILNKIAPIRRYIRKDLEETLVAVPEGVSTDDSQQECANA